MDREKFIEKFNDWKSKLDPMELSKLFDESLARCDWTTKSMIIMEELAELSQEVSKGARDEYDKWDMLQEMADVYICMEFLLRHYDIKSEELDKAIDVKLIRDRDRNE